MKKEAKRRAKKTIALWKMKAHIPSSPAVDSGNEADSDDATGNESPMDDKSQEVSFAEAALSSTLSSHLPNSLSQQKYISIKNGPVLPYSSSYRIHITHLFPINKTSRSPLKIIMRRITSSSRRSTYSGGEASSMRRRSSDWEPAVSLQSFIHVRNHIPSHFIQEQGTQLDSWPLEIRARRHRIQAYPS